MSPSSNNRLRSRFIAPDACSAPKIEAKSLFDASCLQIRSIIEFCVTGPMTEQVILPFLLKGTSGNLRCPKVEEILKESKGNKWPYPKTFNALKEAGVEYYVVHFSNEFNATYYGTFGTYQEAVPEGYKPELIAKEFSSESVKKSLIEHMQGKTTYTEFLIDLGKSGASHYKVVMEDRTVTYFNDAEDASHEERVPG